jgi:hypothetical protein
MGLGLTMANQGSVEDLHRCDFATLGSVSCDNSLSSVRREPPNEDGATIFVVLLHLRLVRAHDTVVALATSVLLCIKC